MIDSLTASDDAQHLIVAWQDGGTSTLSAAELRRQARDAWSIRQRMDHGEIAVAPGLRITAMHAVGAYGVNVQFSDGHDRAIYPFQYLRELSGRTDN